MKVKINSKNQELLKELKYYLKINHDIYRSDRNIINSLLIPYDEKSLREKTIWHIFVSKINQEEVKDEKTML